MNYEYEWITRETRAYLDKKTRISWPYIPCGQAQTEHEVAPVAGDIGYKGTPTEHCLVRKGQKTQIYQYKQRLRWNETVLGFIPCTDETGKKYSIRVVHRSHKVYIWGATVLGAALVALAIWGIIWLTGGKQIDLENATTNLPVYSQLQALAGEPETAICLENPPENLVSIRYYIYLRDTGELLYRSRWLQPGETAWNITLQRALEPGQYPILIQQKTRLDSNTEVNLNDGRAESLLTVN